ncbi:Protein CBG23277 [Caenorhabditis briggsae]|uniref:Protein CBG23277 n=1 Tax=Caenorhabditis briggsae TaxID=6238 RepID=A8Y4A6_CAEBR|nr:Protein CBG23277 [Caenorhabditis briggsae]CAP39726.2 Protein CBG23277 [Caenorhabditis briggsae]
MIAAPTPSSKRTEDDGGNFSADSQSPPPLNSDDEQLDDTPFLSHQLPDDHESFSEKFLRNILTHDYQNLMPRRREKFVEITKTVTVTEIVNGAPDKHPSSCEVKVTNVSPAGPHPVNVSIKHLHEKWHSCEELDKSDDGEDLGKGTVIRIQETHKPFNYTQKRQQPSKFVYEDVMNTKVCGILIFKLFFGFQMESSTKPRQPSSANSTLFNRSSDNIIDLEFRHPILVETSENTTDDQKHQQQNGNNGTRRRFADLRKKVSTTTKTSVTETEKVTTTRRSSSAHSTSSKRSYSKPEVHTLYYRKFVDEENKGGDDDSSDSGSVIIHRDSVTRRSRSADHLQQSSSQTMSPIAPPRKRLGREESLHYYRDDEEVIEEQTEKKRRVTLRSPEPGNTSISMNDTAEKRNITAGITSISMNDACTDTSFESRFSTIPRARSSPPGIHRVNHIHVNVIGPIRTPETERKHRVVGRVGDDVTMDIFIERRRSSPNSRRGSYVSHGSTSEAPPKPPRRSKYEDHVRIGDPIATSTPMTTIERKQTREERVSTESGQSSRKSTRSARPPDINIIECETFIRETRSPARTPATPIVVINQTPSSRRGSQDLLGEPGQRRRKSTLVYVVQKPDLLGITDTIWQSNFVRVSKKANRLVCFFQTKIATQMVFDISKIVKIFKKKKKKRDPSSPTKLARPPFVSHSDDRKTSRDVRRRASDSSMIGLPPADIDLNQIFSCTAPPEIKKDEKCQCNACRLIRMSEAERAVRIERASRSRQSRSFTKTTEYETRASTLPSRHRTSPVNIELEDIFNPKPSSPPSTTTKPPTPPTRRRHAPTSPTAPSQSSIVDESSRHLVTTTIDRKQVTPVTTNSRDSQLHARDQLLNSSDDWVGQMMNDANEWETRVSSRKSSVLSTSSSTARKVSVARRISIDELKKPEKRKSREAVPLPPSDHSIDDIFTALTTKKDDIPKETERKTFIVTRKQRAQDVDIIDFEKDREAPVAPPRHKNIHSPKAQLVLKDKSEDPMISPQISTSTLNLEDVFTNRENSTRTQETDEKDQKIRKRVAEFTKAHQETEMSRSEKTIDEKSRAAVESIISMDDVFGSPKFDLEIPLIDNSVTSTASIEMKSSESHLESQSNEAKRSTDVPDVISTSSIRMRPSEHGQNDNYAIGVGEDDEAEKKENRTSAVSIDLDKVFVEGSTGKPDFDASDEKIRRGITEFERAKQEKDAQRSGVVVTTHFSKHLFDESDISMDDVFKSSQREESSIEMKSPDETSADTIALSAPKESAEVNLDNVFVERNDEKPSEVDEEEKNIRKRMEEFKKAEEEKHIQKSDEPHPSHHVFDESNISLDDIFNVSHSGTNQSEDVDQEEQHIRRRIEEFKKAEEEKKRNLITESHSSHQTFNSSNISMDDVFNRRSSSPEPSTEAHSKRVPAPTKKTNPVDTKQTAEVNLDNVFVERHDEKPSEVDEEEKHIRKRMEEFKKAEEEKQINVTTESHVSHHVLDDSKISLDDVFNTSLPHSSKPSEDVAQEEQNIRRRIEEFKNAEEEKQIQMKPESRSSHTKLITSNISIDDVFNTPRPNVTSSESINLDRDSTSDKDGKPADDAVMSKSVVKETISDEYKKEISTASVSMRSPETSEEPHSREENKNRASAVSIDLDKVFVEGSTGKSDFDASDEKIRRGIAEFERAKQEKDAQRSGVVVTTHSSKHLFDESDISMEDVFNPSQREGEPLAQMKRPDQTSSATISLSDAPKESAGISLDNVFVEGHDEKSSEVDEEEKHIRKRMEEFKKAEEEKLIQKSEETHPSRHVFDDSNISMDDVFNVSHSGINQFQDVDQEEQHIRRRIEEFKKAEEEKRRNLIVESHSSHQTFDASNISMDDVFNRRSSSPEPSTEAHSERLPSPTESNNPVDTNPSESQFTLEDVFFQGSSTKPNSDVSDERIRKGIAEFEKVKRDKEVQGSVSTKKPETRKKNFDDSNISLDVVFNTTPADSRRSEYQPSISEGRPERISTTDEDTKTKTETTTYTETEAGTTCRRAYGSEDPSGDAAQPAGSQDNFTSTERVKLGDGKREDSAKNKNMVSTVGINLDDIFVQGIGKSEKHDDDDQKKESQQSLIVEHSLTKRADMDEQSVSLDDVFNTTSEKEKEDSHDHLGVTSTSSIRMRSSEDHNEMRKEPENIEESPKENRTSAVSIDLDKLFVEGSTGKSDFDASDEKIRRGIAEFKKAKQEKDAQRSGVVVTTHSTKHLFDESDISMDDVFNASHREEFSIEMKSPDETSTATISLSAPKESAGISLDNVFVERHDEKPSEVDEEEKHIRKRIEEFKKAEEEKNIQKSDEPHPSHHVFDESNISLDDIFNVSHSGTNRSEDVDQEEQHIRRRIEEFKKAEEEKQRNLIVESHSSHQTFDASNISMDDVFNTSASSGKEHFDDSLDDSPDDKTRDSGFMKTTSEKTTTTTTTRTEISTDSYSKRTVTTLDDLFGPQTCTPQSFQFLPYHLTPISHQLRLLLRHNLSSLMVPGKWNESMMSNASTISLDDSFNNSFAKSGNSQVYEPKMRKPLALPVDNWIDNLVATVTDEATREAPKTPKSAIEDYYRSPTRISQEIKYEWVAKLIEDDANKDREEEKEEHQSEEEHLRKPDDTWVSSVVYRPTLETSTYTLRSSQMEPERKAEIDMDRVFNECLIGKQDDEECECSACRLTEQELEDIKRRKIETQNKTREERQSVSHDSEERRTLTIMNPSEFSIDDIFNPEGLLRSLTVLNHQFSAPLTIQTDHAPAPSTSSPPLQSTRTYYISPKVSETVTTTHQWKDADISMDEIFSPVSSTTNENRRFSNFYEDRSGWDTIGSEDSGVMSGGDRGRRRSTRITDHVIDEAFKGIFDSQPTTSAAAQEPDKEKNNYDDYYITSIHQEEIGSSDSDVDPENLDVSQFVDDILGKSMDEAAFFSSTKSLRDHTDTSIDRKKSNEKLHSYYRTRTDTSIDRRVKPEVINEDLESSEAHDELLKLVFVDPSDSSSISKSDSRRSLSLPRNRSIRPSDEELLEIEIKPDYFVIKGSYSLLIPKSDPLGLMLQVSVPQMSVQVFTYFQKLREQNNGLATLDFSLTRKLKKLLVNCIREKAGCLDMSSTSSKYEGLLSSRGQSLIESIDHASATFLKMNVDKYEPTRNPNGVVNFCTAENNICTPLLEERFKHLELFFPNTEHLVRYPPGGGWPEAREVLVKYFREFMGARVTVDELALTPSTRTGYDVTSYCLFEADDDFDLLHFISDILLTNGPAYAGTISNVQEKAQCVVACVETDLSNPRLDVNKYEEELKRQTDLENTVSGVIIVNPHNPLGVTFPPEDVVNLCNWATSKNLHVVIDEVFANCVFDKPNSKFRPFLSYRHRVHRPENVAWLWSVSKDFGLPGLKFAVIHSANEGLRRAATKLQMYYPCSPFVQDFAINLLSDSVWLREFHSEVNRRISIHYRYTAQNLERLEIPFVPAQAGIFVFADFSKLLSTVDSAGELELFENLATAGVMLTPGVHQNCHVFGWFRIVFACTKEELEEGFRRLFTYFGSHLHPIGTVQYDN